MSFPIGKTLLPVLSIIFAIVLGFLLGRMIRITSQPIPPTVIRADLRPRIPVVRIDDIRDGQLAGISRGEVRLFLGETLIIPSASGSFLVPAGNLLRDVATVRAPPGMRFVASRKGRKYYPVTSPNAARLAAGNRVYFTTAKEAEGKGFARGN